MLAGAVSGIVGLLARARVQVVPALLARAVLLRVPIQARAVLAGRELPVAALLRLRVLACRVRAARGLIARDVLQRGDELTDAELSLALLLGLAWPVAVMLRVGSAAPGHGELARLTELRTGGLLIGGVLARAAAVVLADAVILTSRVLARAEWRSDVLLRLFIVASAVLGGPGRAAAVAVHARPGRLADPVLLAAGSVLRLLRAGPVLPDGVLRTPVNGEAASLGGAERRDLAVARWVGDIVGVDRLVTAGPGSKPLGWP